MAILDKHVERGRRANELGQQRRYYPSIYIVLFFSPFYFFFLMILPSIVACRRSSLSPADIVAQVFKVAEHFQFPSIRFKKNYSLVISTVDLIRSSDYTTADEYEIRPVVDLFFFLFVHMPIDTAVIKKGNHFTCTLYDDSNYFFFFRLLFFLKRILEKEKKKKVNKFERRNKKPQQPTWWHGHIPVAFLPLCVHLPRFRAQTLVTTCCSNCCCCCCCCRVECRQRRAVRGFARCQTAMSRKSSQPHP